METSKEDKSKLSKPRFKWSLKKKNQENYTEITEGMYTAKSFLILIIAIHLIFKFRYRDFIFLKLLIGFISKKF